jgi:selenocysteine-specific elongation factor
VEELYPGEEGWIQLELRDPVVAVRGDRYILRRPSPGETLGGGMVVDHKPKGRHKRFDESILNSLDVLLQGSPTDILFEAALGMNIASLKDIINQSRLEREIAKPALNELMDSGKLIILEKGEPEITSDMLAMALPNWNVLHDKSIILVDTYHRDFPLRQGIPREELKSRLKLSQRSFNAIIAWLIDDKIMTDPSSFIARVGHEIKLNGQEQASVEKLMRRFEQNPFSPPSLKEIQAEVGDEVVNALLELNRLVAVSSEVIFRRQDYDLMAGKIRNTLEKNERITLAEVRDLFKTSRKYAQALLEYLDMKNITVRDGDFRKLKH